MKKNKYSLYKGFLPAQLAGRNDKKLGILFGTFDIVHQGHLNLFAQAKSKSDYIIAVIARDKTVFQIKGKNPVNTEKLRLKNVKEHRVVDKVILGSLADRFAAIKKYLPDIIFLGYDQNAFTENLELKLMKRKIKSKIIRLKPFKSEIYKTSKILNHKSKIIN